MSNSKILFKGGTLLIHDVNDHVVPTNADLLVNGDRIAKIEKDIVEPAGCRVVDAADKIISPGFIDAHRHLWQTQLKGYHVNHTLMEYLPIGVFGGSGYTPDDVFWGQLAGALESIDAGTTTILDHSHINVTPEHTSQAIQATASSGVRAIYSYTQTASVKSFDPLEFNDNSSWFDEVFEQLFAESPWADGRVTLGFTVEGSRMDEKAVREAYAKARRVGVKTITGHGVPSPMFGTPAIPSVKWLDDCGVLDSDIVVSHANFPDPKDGERLAKSGAFVATTPFCELSMGHGEPVGLEPDTIANASLGADCHSIAPASIVAAMNLLLQHQRSKRHNDLAKDGKWARSVALKPEDVFNLGTTNGAKALNMENEIGKLEVGMKADLVVFDGTTPAMIAAAETDPLAAIVIHSSVNDIEMVIIDGIVRKENGKLLEVEVTPAVHGAAADVKQQLSWKDVVTGMKDSRANVWKRLDAIDQKKFEEVILQSFGLDTDNMVPS